MPTNPLSDHLTSGSPADRLSLDGEVVIVTGAAGGIGSAVAAGFGAAGADLALVDRDEEGLDTVRSEIAPAINGRVISVPTDLTDEAAITAMVEHVADTFDRIDVVLNVAGVMSVSDPADLELDMWNLVLQVNLTGAFLSARESFPHLCDGGRIVNIASTAGIYGYGQMAHYAAAKSGLMTLTRSLATAWAADDIRVNAIAPGLISTPVTEEVYGVDPDRANDRSSADRDAGSAMEIADTAVFLASPAASFISGETVTVAGPPPDQDTVFAEMDP